MIPFIIVPVVVFAYLLAAIGISKVLHRNEGIEPRIPENDYLKVVHKKAS